MDSTELPTSVTESTTTAPMPTQATATSGQAGKAAAIVVVVVLLVVGVVIVVGILLVLYVRRRRSGKASRFDCLKKNKTLVAIGEFSAADVLSL